MALERPGFGMELIDDVERKFPYVPGGYSRHNSRVSR